MPTILGDESGTPIKKVYDPSKDPNNVSLAKHGPRPAFIDRFSNTFYERNVSDDEHFPKWERCERATPGSVRKIRIYVRFEKLKNVAGGPLELSKAVSIYWGEKAEWAQLVSYALGIDLASVRDLKNSLDIETMKGKRIMVTTKAGAHGNALLHKFQAAPLEDDDAEVAAPPSSPPIVHDDEDHDDSQGLREDAA